MCIVHVECFQYAIRLASAVVKKHVNASTITGMQRPRPYCSSISAKTVGNVVSHTFLNEPRTERLENKKACSQLTLGQGAAGESNSNLPDGTQTLRQGRFRRLLGSFVKGRCVSDQTCDKDASCLGLRAKPKGV